MKHEVNIEDFLTLLYWVRTYVTVEGKNFKHDKLSNQAMLYKKLNVSFNTNVNDIDDFMLDAHKLYEKLHKTNETVFNIMNSIDAPYIPKVSKVSKESMIKEIEDFENIFEDLFENYNFMNVEIRNMQKDAANEKMMRCVDIEDYENAAKYRDLIKEY